MSIGPIEFPSVSPMGAVGALGVGDLTSAPGAASVSGTAGTAGIGPVDAAQAANGAEFGDLVVDGLDRLEGLTDAADKLAVQAATGQLDNIHDYTIAASEAQVATQLTVALRNKAVEAFNEIMRMQV